MGVGGQLHAPATLLPRQETRYPLYRRLGGPQGRSGRLRKISPPPGFDPQTVQPVVSRYTDSYPGPHCSIVPSHIHSCTCIVIHRRLHLPPILLSSYLDIMQYRMYLMVCSTIFRTNCPHVMYVLMTGLTIKRKGK